MSTTKRERPASGGKTTSASPAFTGHKHVDQEMRGFLASGEHTSRRVVPHPWRGKLSGPEAVTLLVLLHYSAYLQAEEGYGPRTCFVFDTVQFAPAVGLTPKNVRAALSCLEQQGFLRASVPVKGRRKIWFDWNVVEALWKGNELAKRAQREMRRYNRQCDLAAGRRIPT